jgi:hypothetical protein
VDSHLDVEEVPSWNFQQNKKSVMRLLIVKHAVTDDEEERSEKEARPKK